MVSFTLLRNFWPQGGLPDSEARAPPTSMTKRTQGSLNQTFAFTHAPCTNIQQPSPATCPQCGVNLIPVREDGDRQLGDVNFTSERARQLAGGHIAGGKEKHVETELHLVGGVTYDETRLSHVPLPGFQALVNAFVDYTGVKVNEGEILGRPLQSRPA